MLAKTEYGLQGGVRFPTGGIVRERLLVLNRCNSDTDSEPACQEKSGWKKITAFYIVHFMPWEDSQGIFYLQRCCK